MKQVTYWGRGRLRWDEVAEPTLQDERDVLVRPIACSRCDLDAVVLGDFGRKLSWGLRLGLIDPCVCSHFGPRPYRGPFAFGHECVARVVACGSRVAGFSPGQLVVVPFQISCGQCPRCLNGLTGVCERAASISAFGMGLGHPGTLCDLLRVPYADAMLVPVPEGLDPITVASAADNFTDAFGLVSRQLQQRPNADVLVVGGRCASVGLYAVAVARSLGASSVDYADTERVRLDIAERLGARIVEMRKHPSQLYTVVIDASAGRSGLAFAVRSVAHNGIVASAGIYFWKGTPMPLLPMYVRGATFVTGMPNVRADLPNALAFLRAKRPRVDLVNACVAAWEDAPDAFSSPAPKVIVSRV